MMQFQKASGIYKKFYRNGPNHRSGADVSFRDIVKIFGFKTATVGAWVTPQEQQIAANLFFDALCDLMSILQVSEQVISLKGTLSISFGSGGQKHSSAHYNSTTKTLALAKNAGAGSLAHEYFHAFDHFISRRFLDSATAKDFASALWLKQHDVIAHPINSLLESCYQHIFLKQNSSNPSELFMNSVKADQALGCYYYAMPEEVAARAFESFVESQSIKNAFLVNGSLKSAEAELGIYPCDEQRRIISEHFFRYFSTLGQALAK